MTAALAIDDEEPEELRVHVRNAVTEDRNYILDTHRKSWALALEHRRSRARHYNRDFQDLVIDGVLAEPDTHTLVACCPERPAFIYGWLTYTPSRVTAIHYAYVRDERNDIPLRRRGIFGILLTAAGVRDGADVVYTARPKERSSIRDRRSTPELETALLEAAQRHGIVATYIPLSQWLGKNGR